jgi:hypothetical protein
MIAKRLTERAEFHAYAIRRGRWQQLAAPGMTYPEWVNSLTDEAIASIVAEHCGTRGHPRITARLSGRWKVIVSRTHLAKEVT